MKMRCRECFYLDREFMGHDGLGEVNFRGDHHRCGLHGGAKVDPDGEQQNLDRQGGCGFVSALKQRELFDEEDVLVLTGE